MNQTNPNKLEFTPTAKIKRSLPFLRILALAALAAAFPCESHAVSRPSRPPAPRGPLPNFFAVEPVIEESKSPVGSASPGSASVGPAIVAYTQSGITSLAPGTFYGDLTALGYALKPTETYESYTDNQLINEGGTLGLYTYSNFPIYDTGSPLGFLSGRIDNTFDLTPPSTNWGLFGASGGVKSFAAYFTPASSGANALARIGSGPAEKDYFFPGDGFTITVPAGTRAIGLFFNVAANAIAPANALNITVGSSTASNGGSNFDTEQASNDTGGATKLYFVGLRSDTPFTSVFISADPSASTGYNIDNLITAVPEPSSALLLLGSGLPLLLRRRRAAVR